VRPHLEYGSVACNPVTKENCNTLEMVQRRAARFVLGDYGRYSSVDKMLRDLNWETLDIRREKQRLLTFHKIIQGDIELDINKYATRKVTRKRRTHDQQYRTNSNFISTSQFAESFFPSAISQWNELPQSLVNTPKTNQFKKALNELTRPGQTDENKI